MNPRSSHPTAEEWLAWLQLPVATPERLPLQRHHDGCERCRDDVAVLRVVGPALRVPTWARPPETLREAVRAIAGSKLSPAAPVQARHVDWEPVEVRAGSSALRDSARVLARVFEHGELGVVAQPPLAGGRVRLQGRVWMREPADGPIAVLLVTGEHVVCDVAVGADGYFDLEEFVGPNWKLEFHLPQGLPLVVEAPVP